MTNKKTSTTRTARPRHDAKGKPVGNEISRRGFLASGAFFATAVALSSRTAHAAQLRSTLPPSAKATDTPLAIEADDDGVLTILTAEGTALVRIDGFALPQVASTSASVEQDETSDGEHRIRIAYEMEDPAYSSAATYTVSGPAVSIEFELSAPEGAATTGAKVHRELLDPDMPDYMLFPAEIPYPFAQWSRDPRGGVPYLERTGDAYFLTWNSGQLSAAFVTPPREARPDQPHHVSYPFESTDRFPQEYVPTPLTSNESGGWACSFAFRTEAVVGESLDHYLAAEPLIGGALLAAPDLAVVVTSSQTFNLFDEAGQQTFNIGVYSNAAQTVSVELTVRDFDGTVTHQSTHDQQFDSPSAATIPVSVELPGPRSLSFLEVVASGGDSEVLARTTAAVIPPHEFGPPDQSIVGMGGFPSSPAEGATQAPGFESHEEEVTLWQRLGVKHLRNNWLTAAETQSLGIATAFQPAASPGQYADDPEGLQDWYDRAFTLGDHAGISHFELLNEWNLRGDGLGKGTFAEEYTRGWLIPFREEMDRRGSTAKLNSVGLGSWDPTFMDIVRDNGGWDVLDGVAIHPGRGNLVPDLDPIGTGPDTYGQAWNFFGAVRKAKAYLDEYGSEKELWLTEVYAPTKPNAWWGDDERTSADATLLTLALTMAVGATGIHWFQPYDGNWSEKYGVNHTDGEYHYGLTHVDRSPKPELLSFEWGAQILDGAEFLGWIESPHPDLRGLRFRNAEGPFWILWSRQDGYLVMSDHGSDGFYPQKEAWEKHTEGTLTVQIPTEGEIQVSDTIGRALSVAASAGVTVTAEPIVVQGALDPDSLGPDDVEGKASIALTDVSVAMDDADLVVSGINGSEKTMVVRIEDVPTHVTTFDVEPGEFTVTVPDVTEADQFRIFTEVFAGGQVHRAEYYRSVASPDPEPTPDPTEPGPTPEPTPDPTDGPGKPTPTPTGGPGDGGTGSGGSGNSSSGNGGTGGTSDGLPFTGLNAAGLAAAGGAAAAAGAAAKAVSNRHKKSSTSTHETGTPLNAADNPTNDNTEGTNQ